jgi:hypothetical protein
MKKLLMTTAFAMMATASFAQSVSEQVIMQLQAQGFTHIEVKNGPSQVKVEAYRDGMQFEAVYDLATGHVLKQEFGAAENNETQQGVFVRNEDRDFISESDDDRNDDRDDDGNDDDRDDDGNDDDSSDDGIDHDDDDHDGNDDDHDDDKEDRDDDKEDDDDK